MTHPAFKDVFADDTDPSQNTVSVTQTLKTDIIQFLISKYTDNATISVSEIQSMYKTSEDRARRVLEALVEDGVLQLISDQTYKVIV